MTTTDLLGRAETPTCPLKIPFQAIETSLVPFRRSRNIAVRQSMAGVCVRITVHNGPRQFCQVVAVFVASRAEMNARLADPYHVSAGSEDAIST